MSDLDALLNPLREWRAREASALADVRSILDTRKVPLTVEEWGGLLLKLAEAGFAIAPLAALEKHRCGLLVERDRVVYVPESWIPEEHREALRSEGQRRATRSAMKNLRWPAPEDLKR